MIRRNYKRLTGMLRTLIAGKRNVNYHADYFDSNPLVKEVKKLHGKLLSILLRDFNHPVIARDYPHSDINVLKQVLLGDEYKPVIDYVANHFKVFDHLKIIDGGANVGYFSLYVKEKMRGASIACIEPDKNNVDVLTLNLKKYIDTGEIIVYKNGLGPVSEKFLKIAHDFRGGRDWSLTVKESSRPTALKSITVQHVMDDNKWEHLDILKIDIEGGERFLFTKEADLSYLAKVKVLTLEIHDEFNIRDSIYELLKANNFSIQDIGETTIAINKKYFN